MSRFQEEAKTALTELDNQVRSCKASIPDKESNAVAFAAVLSADDNVPVYGKIEMFITMCKQCYRLGYMNGREDLQTQLTPSANQG